MLRKEFQSYWSQTGTYESIVPLINMNFDGLRTDVVTMLSGDAVAVRTTTYQNDMVTFKNKHDVMTLLIHLGYLAYDQGERKAYIPNEEIRSEFLDAIEDTTWNEFVDFQKLSTEVLDATLELDAAKVAKLIEKVHMEYASVIQYNNENSLSSVLSIAYLGAMQYYFKPVREMPLGRGFADFVFICTQGFYFLFNISVFLIQSDDFIYHRDFLILEFFTNIFFYHIRIFPDKLDI